MQSLLSLLRRIPLQHIRVIRFLISGGTAVAVNLSVLWVATEFFHIWYVLSAILGTSAGFVISFALHKFWTFENDGLDRMHMQFSLYVILGVINMGINALFVFLLVEFAHLWYLLAQIISAIVLAVSNFFIYRHFIFSHKVFGNGQ